MPFAATTKNIVTRIDMVQYTPHTTGAYTPSGREFFFNCNVFELVPKNRVISKMISVLQSFSFLVQVVKYLILNFTYLVFFTIFLNLKNFIHATGIIVLNHFNCYGMTPMIISYALLISVIFTVESFDLFLSG